MCYRLTFTAVFGSHRRVTLHSFNRVVNWFGPFFEEEFARDIVEAVDLLHETAWFHGDISKNAAETALSGKSKGTFLVRLSRTVPDNPFTLSVQGPFHYRIKRHFGIPHYFLSFQIVHWQDGDVSILARDPVSGEKTEQMFSSLPLLIEGIRETLRLTVACSKQEVFDGGFYE